LALGVLHGLDRSHLQLAEELMRTCYEMYRAMPTGLSPEVAVFNMRPDGNHDIDTQVSNTPLSTHMHTKGLRGNADGGNPTANPRE